MSEGNATSPSPRPAKRPDLQPSDITDHGIVPVWLARLCHPLRMRWLAPWIGFALTLPSLFSGYIQDDHVLRQFSRGTTIFFERPAWDYFNWLSSPTEIAKYREWGILVPWSAQDTIRFRPFRPIASLLHAFEFKFFDGAPWIMHLDRALLYALIVSLCVKLLSRSSSTPLACGVACLLFAIDDTHAFSSGWISAANTLLSCAFGFFALLMHDAWRRAGSRAQMALSGVAFALSLLSSEGGMGLMGYLIAYAVFLESGTWKKRIATLIPAMGIALAYLVFYATQSFGTGDVSPSKEPLRTALVVLCGTVSGTLSQILSFPPLTLALQMLGVGGVIVAAALLAAVIAVFRGFLGSTKTVGFFATGMVLSIVPFTVGMMMGDRYLLWAGFGAAGLLGELFVAASHRGTKVQRISAKALLFANAGLSPVFFVPSLYWLAPIEDSIRKLETTVTPQNTVMLNVTHPLSIMVAAAIRNEKHGQWPEHFYFLHDGIEPLTLRRTDERTLLATTPKGWYSQSFFTRATRSKESHFKPGQTFDLDLMTATIQQVTEDARPLSVSFAFKRDLAEFAWLRTTSKGPESVQVPAVGAEIRVTAWLWE